MPLGDDERAVIDELEKDYEHWVLIEKKSTRVDGYDLLQTVKIRGETQHRSYGQPMYNIKEDHECGWHCSGQSAQPMRWTAAHFAEEAEDSHP